MILVSGVGFGDSLRWQLLLLGSFCFLSVWWLALDSPQHARHLQRYTPVCPPVMQQRIQPLAPSDCNILTFRCSALSLIISPVVTVISQVPTSCDDHLGLSSPALPSSSFHSFLLPAFVVWHLTSPCQGGWHLHSVLKSWWSLFYFTSKSKI